MMHLPALDGMRGFAAVLVMVSHLTQATGILAPFFRASGGQIGVMIFFALSGFLMAHVYFGQAFKTETLARYAVARFARVVPLFLLVVFASYAGTATGWFRAYPMDASSLLEHLTLQRGESVLWTIPVELRFYAVFCLFWLLYRGSPAVAVAAVGAIAAAYYLVPPGRMPVMRLGHFFLIGVLAWYAATRMGFVLRAKLADALFLLAAFALLLSFPLPFEAMSGRAPRIWWEPQLGLAVFLFLAASVRSPIAGRVLGSASMRRLGDWSYALYLTHVLTFMNLRLVIDPRAHPFLFAAVAMPIVIAQSAVIRRTVERPCQNALRRISPGRLENADKQESHDRVRLRT